MPILRQIRATRHPRRVFRAQGMPRKDHLARLPCWRVHQTKASRRCAAPGFSWKVGAHIEAAYQDAAPDWRPVIGNLVESKQLGGQGPGSCHWPSISSAQLLAGGHGCWWGDGRRAAQFGLRLEARKPRMRCLNASAKPLGGPFLLSLQECPAARHLPTPVTRAVVVRCNRATVAGLAARLGCGVHQPLDGDIGLPQPAAAGDRSGLAQPWRFEAGPRGEECSRDSGRPTHAGAGRATALLLPSPGVGRRVDAVGVQAPPGRPCAADDGVIQAGAHTGVRGGGPSAR